MGKLKMASYGTNNNPFGSDEPDKIQEARKQVDDVVGIMRENVEKVMERDQKLSDLDDRSTQLADSGLQFSRSAKKVRRKYWWENLKIKLEAEEIQITALQLQLHNRYKIIFIILDSAT